MNGNKEHAKDKQDGHSKTDNNNNHPRSNHRNGKVAGEAEAKLFGTRRYRADRRKLVRRGR